MIFRAALLFSFFASTMAFAEAIPSGSPLDSRIQSVDYSELNVVAVNNLLGTSTQILFSADEVIDADKTICGFSDGWTVQSKGNTVFVKAIQIAGVDTSSGQEKKVMIDPEPSKWNTSLSVTTNKHVYQFELKLNAVPTKRTSFLVKFAYPDDERRKNEELERKRIEEERLAAMKPDLTKQPKPHNTNYKYKVNSRSGDIKPVTAYDDGEFTYFEFAPNGIIPAIFAVDQQKQEYTVNIHIDPKMPSTVVVHSLSREFVLRQGKAAVGVFNEAFDQGLANQTGSTVEGAERVLKGAR